MEGRRPSIIWSSFRALFVAAFSVVGIGFGLFLLVILFGLATGNLLHEPEQAYTAKHLTNPRGKRKSLGATAPVVLQLEITGAIGSPKLNEQTVSQMLTESREGVFRGRRVKAVLVRINTPGGTVTDSHGIYSALQRYKELYKVPVYAYVDGLCASGGMYCAAAADKIYASDVSILGSVGVALSPFFNFSEAMEKMGVGSMTITAGDEKDVMNPFRAWQDGEGTQLKQITDFYYDHFVNLLTTNRPQIDRDKLVSEYGARMFPAETAQQMGYVDVAGATREQALQDLAEAAGLEEGKYVVLRLQSQDWMSGVFSKHSPLLTGVVRHRLDAGGSDFRGQPLFMLNGSL